MGRASSRMVFEDSSSLVDVLSNETLFLFLLELMDDNST
jgi:hypothetical protein